MPVFGRLPILMERYSKLIVKKERIQYFFELDLMSLDDFNLSIAWKHRGLDLLSKQK